MTLTAGENRDDIDFAVVPTQYRMVRVIDETTGSPLAGITIDQWSLAGQWMYGPATDSEGWALIRPNSIDGTAENFYAVQVSTDSLGRYIDEVYDHHACPAGTSVYRAGCSLAGAAAVLVSDDLNQVFPPIEIRLRSAIPLFSSGFE